MVEKRERGEKRPYSHSRREFLKSSTKVAASATAYGAAGGFLGHLYDGVRNFFSSGVTYVGNRLSDLDEKVDNLPNTPIYKAPKVAKKAEEIRSSYWSRVFGRTEEDQRKWREAHGIKTSEDKKLKNQEEKYNNIPKKGPVYEPKKSKKTEEPEISRRGFFGNLMDYGLGYSNKHPVQVGAVAGATYGGGKSAIKQVVNGKQRRKIARLEDDVAELKQKIAKHETPEKPTGLEGKALIFIGAVGIVLSLLLISSNITGFSILKSTNDLRIISGLIFTLSIIFIFIGKFIR